MHPGQAELIASRAAKLAELGGPKLQQMASELRTELGAAEYDRLAADAKASGFEISPAILADAPMLRLLAARGQYLRHYERTRPPKA